MVVGLEGEAEGYEDAVGGESFQVVGALVIADVSPEGEGSGLGLDVEVGGGLRGEGVSVLEEEFVGELRGFEGFLQGEKKLDDFVFVGVESFCEAQRGEVSPKAGLCQLGEASGFGGGEDALGSGGFGACWTVFLGAWGMWGAWGAWGTLFLLEFLLEFFKEAEAVCGEVRAAHKK